MQRVNTGTLNTSLGGDYKGIAREKLLGKYSTIIGAILIMQLILFGISYITDKVVDGSTAIGMITYIAIAVITGLISAVFTVGELTIYMKLACGDPISAWDIFSGFTGHPDKAIIVQFHIAVRCLVYLLPAGLAAGILYGLGGIDINDRGDIVFGANHTQMVCKVLLVICIAALIAGVIGTIIVRIRYSQAFYLLIDRPQLEPKEILTESRDMMKHHMWTYLYINLSFIPIILLGILSLGVGLMYIQPYRGMTLTEFYMALVSGELGRGMNIDVVIDDQESVSDQ